MWSCSDALRKVSHVRYGLLQSQSAQAWDDYHTTVMDELDLAYADASKVYRRWRNLKRDYEAHSRILQHTASRAKDLSSEPQVQKRAKRVYEQHENVFWVQYPLVGTLYPAQMKFCAG